MLQEDVFECLKLTMPKIHKTVSGWERYDVCATQKKKEEMKKKQAAAKEAAQKQELAKRLVANLVWFCKYVSKFWFFYYRAAGTSKRNDANDGEDDDAPGPS